MVHFQNSITCSRSATDPLITVAICTYNRAGFLQKTIAALLPQLAEGTELLVVDNASTDRTPELLAELASRSPVKICREEKQGLSIARNTALRETRGEFVLFLDDDAVVKPGWLASYQRFFSRMPNAQLGGAGGAVELDYEIKPPSWMGSETEFVAEPPQDRVCNPGENPCGCNFAVRRAAAIAVGGFNPALGHCGNMIGAHEEGELLDRVRRAGYEVWWLANAGVRHFVEAKRLRLGWHLSAAFRAGGCTAICRLATLPGSGRRLVFTTGRVLIAPFHCLVNLLLAAFSFPFQGGAVAAGALKRVAYITSLTCKLVTQTFNR
jgi:GT2 family glycosyltransferase